MDILSIKYSSDISLENLEKSLKQVFSQFIKSDIAREKNIQKDIKKIKCYVPIEFQNDKNIDNFKTKLNIRVLEFYREKPDFSGIIYFTGIVYGLQHVLGNFTKEKTHTEIHCNIDNETPEKLAMIQRILLDEGANDVWLENILMKKSRPGIKVCVLAQKEQREQFISHILNHTNTLGIRYYDVHRLEIYRYNKSENQKVYFNLKGDKLVKEEFDFFEKKTRQK